MGMSAINNREFPRFDFRPMMWVKVLKKGQHPLDFKMYKLLDISQGGISFICHSSTEFKRKDEFHILEVENELLESPIYAIVKYVKPLDEHGIDFKVGVEFIAKF